MRVWGSLGALAALVLCTASSAAVPSSRIVFAVDRTPLWYGEIYRVNPNGRRVDLSRSPAADVAPAVSPDGKYVAFVSVRGGQARVFVVGSDGRGLRPLSPALGPVGPSDGLQSALAWAPDSRRLAAEVSVDGAPSQLWLTARTGGWRLAARNVSGLAPAWSPDGSRLAYGMGAGLVAVADAQGRQLWRVGGTGTPGWSATGRLAVQQNTTTIDVYDAAGKLLSELAGSGFAWSPDGRVLASMDDGVLQTRADGVGRVTSARLYRGPAAGIVEFVSRLRVRVLGTDGLWHGYDLARRRAFALPAPLRQYGAVSSEGGVAAYTRYGSETDALVLGRKTVATAPTCGDDQPFASLQFVGTANALVYQSGCPVPSADIYGIAPDGTGLQPLTNAPTHEFSPALSPDGGRVAYVRQAAADRCRGCAQSLWVTAPATQLTSQKETDAEPFDADPSWSPDGSTIVFDRSGPNTPPHLLTIAAAGGGGRDLHLEGRSPAWGPKLIAFVEDGAPAAVQTLDPATGEVQTVAANLDPSYLAWSGDGRLAYLAYNARNGRPTIGIVGGATRIDLSRLLPPGSVASGLAWSPDGTRFAFAASDVNGVGEIYTVRVDGTGLTQVTKDLGAVFRFSALSWR